MAQQHEYAREMEEAMTMLDHQFFGDYFRRYNEHLSAIPIAERPVPIPNDKLYSLLREALLSSYPQSNYEYGPFRYKYYHFLMKISPTWVRDCLVKRFVQMPEFWRKLHILHLLIMKACCFVLSSHLRHAQAFVSILIWGSILVRLKLVSTAYSKFLCSDLHKQPTTNSSFGLFYFSFALWRHLYLCFGKYVGLRLLCIFVCTVFVMGYFLCSYC
jgi:hypothetical protein